MMLTLDGTEDVEEAVPCLPLRYLPANDAWRFGFLHIKNPLKLRPPPPISHNNEQMWS